MTIEEQYNIVFINNKRYYIKDINEVEYDLEGSKTYSFEYNDITIYETSWKNMTYKLACELQKRNPKSNDDLIKIKSFWTNTYLFLSNKQTNTLEFNGIYINLGQDAKKFSWMIKQLLEIYEIPVSDCKLIIERKGKSEPKEAKQYFHDLYLEEFKQFLINIKNISEEETKSQIGNIKSLSLIFKKSMGSSAYDSLFDFDDTIVYRNYTDKFIVYLDNHVYYSDATKMNICKNLLKSLNEFINYRNRKKK